MSQQMAKALGWAADLHLTYSLKNQLAIFSRALPTSWVSAVIGCKYFAIGGYTPRDFTLSHQLPRQCVMTRLRILHHPDPRLRTKATPVETFDHQLGVFAENLLETMYAAPGIGLAATQVNVHKRIIVVDVSEEKNQPHTLINPTLRTYGNRVKGEEGCLSVPEVYDLVERFEQVDVTAQDIQGNTIEFTAQGMLAICIQHECDHLDGKLFVDYLSSLKRGRINKKLRARSS